MVLVSHAYLPIGQEKPLAILLFKSHIRAFIHDK